MKSTHRVTEACLMIKFCQEYKHPLFFIHFFIYLLPSFCMLTNTRFYLSYLASGTFLGASYQVWPWQKNLTFLDSLYFLSFALKSVILNSSSLHIHSRLKLFNLILPTIVAIKMYEQRSNIAKQCSGRFFSWELTEWLDKAQGWQLRLGMSRENTGRHTTSQEMHEESDPDETVNWIKIWGMKRKDWM